MQNITVGFSKPKKWKIFAQLIMWGYNIPYDHVYAKFDSPKYNRQLIYQASRSMVNFMGLNVFEDENLIVKEFTLPISDELKIKVMQLCIDNAGKPYGIKLALGLAIVRIAEIFGKTIRNPFDDGTGASYVCCGIVCMILQDMGIQLPMDPDDMTPKTTYDLLMTIKETDSPVV